jgi:RsiW-degrading membrane proteinase PrsW (M82 family)
MKFSRKNWDVLAFALFMGVLLSAALVLNHFDVRPASASGSLSSLSSFSLYLPLIIRASLFIIP